MIFYYHISLDDFQMAHGPLIIAITITLSFIVPYRKIRLRIRRQNLIGSGVGSGGGSGGGSGPKFPQRFRPSFRRRFRIRFRRRFRRRFQRRILLGSGVGSGVGFFDRVLYDFTFSDFHWIFSVAWNWLCDLYDSRSWYQVTSLNPSLARFNHGFP